MARNLTKRQHERLRNAVARGAKKLDAKEPGWFRKVDISLLDLSDARACIVGQVLCPREFMDGVMKLGLTCASQYGFDTPAWTYSAWWEEDEDGNIRSADDLAYQALDLYWIEAIKERFANDALEHVSG